MKKYLGLDLGSKTLGVALSESGVIASNLETYRFKENDYIDASNYIKDLVEKLKIDVVVLGLPKHMNNDLGIRGKISKDFKELILSKVNVEVILWDERLSTKSALNFMIKGSDSINKKKQKKDELAAAIILQNYLDYKGARKC
jgi:putative Holliday junction resolvase